MSKEPYVCLKCSEEKGREVRHYRGKIYEEHAEFAEGIKVTSPPNIPVGWKDGKPEIGGSWRCGKCEGGDFLKHSLHCPKRYEDGKGEVDPPVFRGEGGEIVGLNIPSTGPKPAECEECKVHYKRDIVLPSNAIPEDVTAPRPKRGLLARIRDFFKKKK